MVLGTLSGAPSTRNQALWMGSSTAGNDTTQMDLRLPSLRLRKGDLYTSTTTRQPTTITSMSIKPPVESSGAGLRGFHQCINTNGTGAVFVSNAAGATELVLVNGQP
jgi:hypothetical protein